MHRGLTEIPKSVTIKRYDTCGYLIGESDCVKVYRDRYGYVSPTEHIHRLNRNKDDNRIENLIALPIEFHNLYHKYWNVILYGQPQMRDTVQANLEFWKSNPNKFHATYFVRMRLYKKQMEVMFDDGREEEGRRNFG